MGRKTILDLFCGTKSIANTFSDIGWNTITLDNDIQFEPDILVDILEWDYKQYKPDSFDVIWASPPCQGFSVASCHHHWNVNRTPKSEFAVTSIEMVKRTRKIIDYFDPKYWFIENPRGMLRKMDVVQDLPRNTITYCQYGEINMKPTDIWGVFPEDFPILCCKNGASCHVRTPRGSTSVGTEGGKNNPIEKARIPRDFCTLLAESLNRWLQ